MEYKVLNKKDTKLHNKFSFQDSEFDWAGVIIKGGFNFVNINCLHNPLLYYMLYVLLY